MQSQRYGSRETFQLKSDVVHPLVGYHRDIPESRCAKTFWELLLASVREPSTECGAQLDFTAKLR
jgi:hypothetical protein